MYKGVWNGASNDQDGVVAASQEVVVAAQQVVAVQVAAVDTGEVGALQELDKQVPGGGHVAGGVGADRDGINQHEMLPVAKKMVAQSLLLTDYRFSRRELKCLLLNVKHGLFEMYPGTSIENWLKFKSVFMKILKEST